MELIFPTFYHQFKCIASACPDSCCYEWDVQVDPDSAARYQALSGPLGDDLRAIMYEDGGDVYIRNQDNRCPMWRSDGLCRIQAELGHDALCHTCREFPRLRQDYGSFVELGLEMSCPEAARIMLTQDLHLTSSTVPGGEEGDYDKDLMALLRTTRPEALALLSDPQYTVPQRLALLLLYGYHVQSQIDGAEPTAFDPAVSLAEAHTFASPGDISSLVVFFSGLELLTARWRVKLSGPTCPTWHDELCRMAQYGIYRYYYQAVSDYDLVCRIKHIVTGCILTAHLSAPTFPSLLETAQLYSKEIENDAENVDAILDGAYTAPALTDANLLGLLLR